MAEQIRTGGRRRLLARAVLTAALAVGVLVPLAAPAEAATGSCTISGAPQVVLGAPNVARGDCYPKYLLTAYAGDVVSIDVDATAFTGIFGSNIYFYRPGTTDANKSSGYTSIGCSGGDDGDYWQLICTLPLTGTYVVNVDPKLVFTPTLVPGTRNPATVDGGCTIMAAPLAPPGVPQYAESELCDAGTGVTNWRLNLVRGDRVVFYLLGTDDDSGSLYVYPPGTTDFNVNGGSVTPVCRVDTPFRGGGQGSCGPVAASGTYTIRTSYGAFRFVPTVVHSVSLSTAHKKKVKHGKKFTVTTRLTSPAGTPSARCSLQYRSGSRWKPLSTVTAYRGVCTLPGRFKSRGARSLRVVETGRSGWASVTSKTFTVRVV